MESYTRVHDQTTVNTRHIVIEHRLSARAHRPNSEQGETDNACVHNALQGPLPSAIARMPALTSLFLENNQLNSSLPSELGSMTKLMQLELDNNHFECAS